MAKFNYLKLAVFSCVVCWCSGAMLPLQLKSSLCPPDKPIVFCFVDPCRFAQCPAYPAAECRSNYCGGCNAEWFVGKTQVDCECKDKLWNCFVDPCSVAKMKGCPAYPGATCVSNYCGGCNAEWYQDGKQVDCECPKDKPLVYCKVAPCDVSSCPAYPNAICRNDYCGGCHARWFVDGEEVNCKQYH